MNEVEHIVAEIEAARGMPQPDTLEVHPEHAGRLLAALDVSIRRQERVIGVPKRMMGSASRALSGQRPRPRKPRPSSAPTSFT